MDVGRKNWKKDLLLCRGSLGSESHEVYTNILLSDCFKKVSFDCPIRPEVTFRKGFSADFITCKAQCDDRGQQEGSIRDGKEIKNKHVNICK